MGCNGLTRRSLLKGSIWAVGAFTIGGVSAKGLWAADDREIGPRRPNILYVFADQMRSSAMGCMGNNIVRTPNLDRLAAEGVLFRNAFSSCPICSPYRATLQTGKYPATNKLMYNGALTTKDEHTFLPQVLKEAGYATGYVGKWDLARGAQPPLWVPEEWRFGWEFWAVKNYGHRYLDSVYFRDEPVPIKIEGFEPDVQTDIAIQYMRDHVRKDGNGPFCLMMSWGPPHDPYHQQPEKYKTMYDPADVILRPNVPGPECRSIGMPDQETPEGRIEVARRHISWYYGLITNLDDNMGRLMKALDELGIAHDTLVCFSSDHGDMLMSHGYMYKGLPYEESIHIPFIMRYPARIKPAQDVDFLFNSVDVMPTLLGFAGARIPADVQGVDRSPLILGQTNEEADMAFFGNRVSKSQNLPKPESRSVRTKEWMYSAKPDGDWLLFNLNNDPFEMENLVHEKKHRERVEYFRRRIAAWLEETGDEWFNA